MNKLERAFQSRLMLALSKEPGVRVWRTNVGTVKVSGTDRYFHAGPPPGAADLTGVVGPEGWLVQIECKARGRKRTAEQFAWADVMVELGAIYILAEAERGVDAIVNDLRQLVADRRGGKRR